MTLGAVLIGVGCRRASPPTATSPIAALPTAPANDAAVAVGQKSSGPVGGGETLAAPPPIIVYLIDTLRADRVGLYGSAAGLTPNIDGLARDAVVFEQAYAAAPWTLPSIGSMFTGQFLNQHSLIDFTRILPPEAQPLGRLLADTGYRNAVFMWNSLAAKVADKRWGFEVSFIGVKPFVQFDLGGAMKWVERVGDKPFHLYLHTTEPHNPYMAPAEWRQRHCPQVSDALLQEINARTNQFRLMTKVKSQMKGGRLNDNSAEQQTAMKWLNDNADAIRGLYDANVAWADNRVGEMIAFLKQRNIWDRCVFVVVADHGEEFGEHGGWQHDQSLYEELIRVPLILKLPAQAHAGRRVATPVSLVDLAPTLLGLASRPPPTRPQDGRSLLGLLADGADSAAGPRVVSVRCNVQKHYRPFKEMRGDHNVAVRDGRLKAIWNVQLKSLELYDLQTDPAEQRNIAAERSADAARLADFAATWWAAQPEATRPGPTAQLDRRARDTLKNLGYIEGNDDPAADDAPPGASEPTSRPAQP